MEACLLCLENCSDMANSIRIDSKQWKKENVKFLIEKFLWPMETLQQYSLLCSICWQEIYDFHKFYLRIEKVQFKAATRNVDSETYRSNGVLKNDCKELFEVKESLSEKDNLNNNHFQVKCKKNYNIDNVIEEHFEPEILLEDILPTDFVIEDKNICLNNELNKGLCSNNLQVNKICKREQIQTSINNIKDQIRKDPLNKTESNALESRGSNDSGAETESQSDSQPLERTKRKRKNPDEKTGQEYDKCISENFQIVCSLCFVLIKDFIALRKHFRDMHNRRGFVICCKKKIFSRPLLVDHIQTHLDPNYFKCQQCEKVYSERSTLENHVKIHDKSQQERYHTCDKCGKNFVGTTQLLNHKRIHEPGYEKQFSCSECGKFFTTSHSLNYHIQAIHHNKFVNICDICGKTMRCRNQFKLHMEKHNSKESMSISCDICGLRLTDRRGLRRHKNSQHPVGGKKDYSCHLCPKISPNREALKTHIRLTHSTNYDHKCTICDKAFKRSNALKEHLATHTGTALYSCPWCPKTFISNGNMHNHRKKAHPSEWEEAHRKRFANNLPSDQNSI